MTLETHSEWKRRLFIATIVIAVVTAAWHIYINVTLTQYGMGLRINIDSRYIYVDAVEPDGPAWISGLRENDRLVSFNGQDLSSLPVEELREVAIHAVRSSAIEMTIRRNGEERTLFIEPDTFSFSPFYMLILVVSLLYIIMGNWVFFARPNYPAANAWGFFAVLMSTMVFTLGGELQGSETIGLIFSVLLVTQIQFGVAAGLHFALVFPRPTRFVKKRWLVPTLYLIPAVLVFLVILFMLFVLVFDGMRETAIILSQIINLFISIMFLVYIALTILVLITTYVSNSDPSERRRIRLLIFGTALPLSAILILMLLGNFIVIEISTFETVILLALAIVPFTYLYAIVRYRAMEIRLILKRGLVYSMLTGALVILAGALFIALFGLMLLIQESLPGLLGREGGTFYQLASDDNVQKFMIAILSVFIGATVGSIKKKVQNFVDRRFYRNRYSYKQAVESLTAVISQTHDLDHMITLVLSSADEVVHPQSLGFVTIDDSGIAQVRRSLHLDLDGKKLKKDSVKALKSVFAEGRKYLSMRELNEEKFADGELLHATMTRLRADMLIPIINRERLYGVMSLGKKRSETGYNSEELNLLYLLADQAALSLEHINLAIEASEKEKLKRELAIGRLMQKQMLPAELPKRPGLKIAALNNPAREVSGDFYTWVDLPDNELGIIVGDIVGKGVAGALNMAAIISTLGLIAEESTSISEALQRLNRYLVNNWPKRSFAAITFSRINQKNKQFSWVSGGLPDPIYIPAGGSPRFLEQEDYPLPPGASSHSVYKSQSINYSSGDTIILLTDGAIEVSDPDSDEIIGFEGILEFFSSIRDEKVNDMVEALATYVHSFQKSDILSDDMTVVAIHFK